MTCCRLKDIRLVFSIFVSAVFLSSCAAIDDIRKNEVVESVGSFELNPVRPNSYWYNGASYEYNQYEIRFSSNYSANILLNGKRIGTTPFVYKYTGTLYLDDRVVIFAAPIDESVRAEERRIRVREPLPREFSFDLKHV